MASDEVREVRSWIGRTLVDGAGVSIGRIDDVYLDGDGRTDRPEWLTVHTGAFGTHVSFVPIASAATTAGEEVRVPFLRSQVEDAPRADPGEVLSVEDEDRLYRHYGLAAPTP